MLSFKGRRRKLMQPGLYTELFFLDEATALASGHRPCFECRRTEAASFREGLLRSGHLEGGQSIDALDALAAGEIQSVLSGAMEREAVSPQTLPDGAIYAAGDDAWLKHDGAARRWSFAGYGPRERLHTDGLRLTPRITCEALRAGYKPHLHPSVNT